LPHTASLTRAWARSSTVGHPIPTSRHAAWWSGLCTTVLTSVELMLALGFALPRNSRASAVAQPYDSCYLFSLSRRPTPTPSSMSSLLNRLMPSSRSSDLVIRGVVLFLDGLDVVSMHTVVRAVRGVVRAIRVSPESQGPRLCISTSYLDDAVELPTSTLIAVST
jgi:hypothetical protein